MLTFGRNDHVFAVSDHVRDSMRYPAALARLRMPPVETLYHGIDPTSIEAWAEPERRARGARDRRGRAGRRHGRELQVAQAARSAAARGDARATRTSRTSGSSWWVRVRSSRSSGSSRDRSGLDDTVVFTGFREDAPRVCSTFDVFALSSEHEGLSIALIEALALGKPAVVTDVGGLPRWSRTGGRATSSRPGDRSALARSHRRVCCRIRRSGRGWARKAAPAPRPSTSGSSVRRMEQVYEELLS